jgi:hypothetical protein
LTECETKLEGIFSLKEEKTPALKAFAEKKDVFCYYDLL